MKSLAQTIDKNRCLLGLAVLAVTAFCVLGLFRLDFSVDPYDEFGSSASRAAEREKFFEAFGSDYRDCILLVTAEDIFSPKAVSDTRRLSADLRDIDGIEGVYSFYDVLAATGPGLEDLLVETSTLRRAALENPMIVGQLLSEDGTTALILAQLDDTDKIFSPQRAVIEDIRRTIGQTTEQSTLRIRLTGTPVFGEEITTISWRETVRIFLLSNIIAGFVALLLFRNIAALIVVGGTPWLGILWTLGVMGWLNVEWTMLSEAIPTMLLAIGFTDAVHLVIHMRRHAADGSTIRLGSVSAIETLTLPCALTSLTTAVGFGSLMLAGSPTVQNMGFCCSVGTIITFLAVITVVPLAGSRRFGRWCAPKPASGNTTGLWDRFAVRLAKYPLNYPRQIATVGIVLTVAMLLSVLKLRADTGDDWIPPEMASYRAYESYCEAFGGGLDVHVLVEWPQNDKSSPPAELPTVLEGIHAIFIAEPETHHPISALNLLRCLPLPQTASVPSLDLLLLRLLPDDLSSRFVNLDHSCALASARYESQEAATNLLVFERLERSLCELNDSYKDITITLTGSLAAASEAIYALIIDLAKSLAVAALIITTVMTIAFRSIRYGIICLIPNIFPLSVICAVMAIMSRPLQPSDTVVFTICLGIAVDDTIHFVSRFRRERRICSDDSESVRRSFISVGRVLVITTIIFLIGFGTALTSEITGYRVFGGLACLGFLSALLGDLVLLPALLLCFGKSSAIQSSKEAGPTVE